MHGRSSAVALRYAWLRAPPHPTSKPPKPIAPLDTWPHMRVARLAEAPRLWHSTACRRAGRVVFALRNSLRTGKLTGNLKNLVIRFAEHDSSFTSRSGELRGRLGAMSCRHGAK